jgi:eukaryotic-like serine/threonine-protein kinase
MSTDPNESRLLDLLVQWDDLRQQGLEVSPETICQSCPELAEELQRHIRRQEAFEGRFCPPAETVESPSVGDLDQPPSEPPKDGPTVIASCTNRYRLLRFHARGGLGRVSVARDEGLDREVALKEIQPSLAQDTLRRSRFLLEAQVTGNLEHPGIVPVYGLGSFADGRPFYAMRFVSGETLASAIDRFHRTDRDPGWKPGERSLALRGLLGRLIDVANAVAYAHSRGVLHRDLKPNNVMLGPYGETLVVDWGLAKILSPSGPATSDCDGAPATRSQFGHELIETIPGTAFGTPAYMSPEQAVGDPDGIGPPSDVYSVGATLYCLLTGRAPFQGGDAIVLLSRVQTGQFPRPRTVAPNTPAALEAICLKAMALRPADRYQTPREMADDIEHWLADEPVSAYRERRAERISRWLRRHRTWTRAVAAALVLVSIVSIVAVVAVERAWSFEHSARLKEQLARYEAGVQRDKVQEARRQADANFATAREAVNRLMSELAKTRLAAVPEAERLRRQVAADAAEFNERFLRMRPDDPGVQFDAARVFREVANIDRMLGQFDQSVAAYTRSVELLEALAESWPAKPEYRDRLAETLTDAGEGLRMEGRPREAEPFYRKAIDLADHLLADSPSSVAFRRTKADCLVGLAAALLDLGRPAEAQAAGEQAVASFRDVGGGVRSSHFDSLLLAMMLEDWAKTLARGGRSHEAEPPLLESIGRLTALRDEPLDPSRLRRIPESLIRDNASFCLALAQTELGLILSAEPARRGEAERAFDAAITGLDRLGASRTPIPLRRAALGQALLDRGSLRTLNGLTHEAESDWTVARKLLSGLVSEFPHNAAYRTPLALALERLGRLAVAKGDLGAARPLLEEAVVHHRRALEANPDSPADRQALPQLLKDLEAAGGAQGHRDGRPKAATERPADR